MTGSHAAIRLRWIGIVLLVVLLAWMPFEATSQHGAILLATAGSAYLAWLFAARRMQAGMWRCWHFIALGLVTGLVLAPATLGLMALKTGIHGHAVPDYTAGQILAVVGQAPIFTLSGLLVGIGLDLYCQAQRVTARR